MPELHNTHAITPVHLTFAPDTAADVARALDQLLKARGTHIEQDNKTFGLAAFATAAEAQQAIAQPGERILVEKLPEFRNADNCVWVSVTSLKDPMLPAVLLREVIHSEEIILPLLETCESPAFAEQLKAFNELLTPAASDGSALREVFTQLVLYEIQGNMLDELSSYPVSESLDLVDRGGYVGESFGVDPVDTLLDDPYALSNAANEHNFEYIGDTENQAISQVMRESWNESTAEDLMPILEALGHEESAIEERLREWCLGCLSQTGVVEFDLKGDCAITARPMLGKEGVYISFDGVTSSAYNAVVDADYLAMLDMLRIDVRGWVDHLATSVGMTKPNWDIDLKAIVEEALPLATFDAATGYHWYPKAEEAIKETLLQALFHLPPLKSAEVTQEQQEAARAAHAAYRNALNTDATDAETDALRAAHQAALKALEDQPGQKDRETAEYLFDIALQPLKADAEALDATWLTEQGVDLDALAAITTATGQYKAFPQLAKSPSYYMALANLGSGGSVTHDWLNPPNAAPTDGQLISNSKLTSILENANYSGNLVFAFSCDLDDLQKIGVAAQSNDVKEIRVDGAYLHIHDYNNGAGDGEELDAVWTFTTGQLKDKSIVLRNDTGNSYGIQGVFGQFLADDCGIVIKEPTKELVKRLENSESPALG